MNYRFATGTNEPAPTNTAELPPARALNRLEDRCDRCRAQAFVTASRIRAVEGEELSYQDLLFCGHHGARYSEQLEDEGWIVEDYTDQINPKPSPSANAV